MADRRISKNEATAARRRVYFHCVDVLDGMTPATGEAGGQPQASVDGAAWADTGVGVLVAIGNGRYYAELTQALVNVDDAVIETRYKSANTAEAVGDSAYVDSTIALLASATVGLAQLDTEIDTLTTRLTATRAGYLDQLEHIHDDTDGLKALTTIIAGYLDTEIAAILAAVDTEVAAIKAKTDSLTFTLAGKLDANMLAINGGLTSGHNATLRLAALSVNNPSGSGVSIQSQNGHGLELVGTGAGRAGLAAAGPHAGIWGFGITNGDGLRFDGQGTGVDMRADIEGTVSAIAALLGTPAGASVSADIAAIPTDADVATAAAAALAAYDPPTRTEATSDKNEILAATPSVDLTEVTEALAALHDFDPTADTVAHVTLVDTTTTLTNGSTGGGTSTGPGADRVTLALGALGAGAEVWITTDDAGANVIAGTLVASDAGNITFDLDDGETYYRWAKKPGVNFNNPAEFIAIAD